MELTVKGTPNEIKKALLVINDDKECKTQLNVSVSRDNKGENFLIAAKRLNHIIDQSTDNTTMIIQVHG